MWASPTAWTPRTVGAPSSSTKRRRRLSRPPIGLDPAQRLGRTVAANRSLGPGSSRQARSNRSAAARRARSSPSAGGHGQRHRQRPAVAGDAEELQVAQVAGQAGSVATRAASGGNRYQRVKYIRPLSITTSGIGHPERLQPGGQPRAPPPGRDHDEVGVERRPVAQRDPADGRAGTAGGGRSRPPGPRPRRRCGPRRRARPGSPGAGPSRASCAARSGRPGPRRPAAGSPRLAVVGIVVPPTARRSSRTSGKRSRSST